MEKLTIGKLAEVAEVGVETIRFYERRGLLRKPQTKSGAFRIYAAENISKIRFIKRAQELGFTLNEIKELILLDQNTRATCDDVADRAKIKLNEVKTKIHDLQLMEAALTKLIRACSQSATAKACCRVSDCLEDKCY